MSTWDVMFLLGILATFAGFSGMLAYGSWVTRAAPEPLPGAASKRGQALAAATLPADARMEPGKA